MSKHTPLIRLQAAADALRFAEQNCAHWDHEGHDAHEHYECCYILADARTEKRLALKAWHKHEAGK